MSFRSNFKYCSSLPLQDAQVHRDLSLAFQLTHHLQKATKRTSITAVQPEKMSYWQVTVISNIRELRNHYDRTSKGLTKVEEKIVKCHFRPSPKYKKKFIFTFNHSTGALPCGRSLQ